MTAAKIAISVPEDVLKGVRRAVAKGRAASVSAYVTAAIEQKARLDELEETLDEMLEETGGALSVAEAAEADRVLGVNRCRGKRPGRRGRRAGPPQSRTT